MKLPRDLKHLCERWEYRRIHQVGSHVILQTEQPAPHRVSIPAHAVLRVGTLNSILASVAAHKSATKEEILKGA